MGKQSDPCDPVWTLSRIVKVSVDSRYGGDLHRASRETGANIRVLEDVLHQFADRHERRKLARLVDDVVGPMDRHRALSAVADLCAPTVIERVPLAMPMPHGAHRMRI